MASGPSPSPPREERAGERRPFSQYGSSRENGGGWNMNGAMENWGVGFSISPLHLSNIPYTLALFAPALTIMFLTFSTAIF
jgi:hypothetical protein